CQGNNALHVFSARILSRKGAKAPRVQWDGFLCGFALLRELLFDHGSSFSATGGSGGRLALRPLFTVCKGCLIFDDLAMVVFWANSTCPSCQDAVLWHICLHDGETNMHKIWLSSIAATILALA